MPTIEDTIPLVKNLYGDELDKSGCYAYEHPIAVYMRLPEWASDDLKHAALMHDLIEDKLKTTERLLDRGYSQRTVELIKTVSQKPHTAGLSLDEKNRLYALSIAELIQSDDEEAIMLKYADMSHNLSNERMDNLPREMRERLQKKYAVPYQQLKNCCKLIDMNKCKADIVKDYIVNEASRLPQPTLLDIANIVTKGIEADFIPEVGNTNIQPTC